jgi:hypothetical protein
MLCEQCGVDMSDLTLCPCLDAVKDKGVWVLTSRWLCELSCCIRAMLFSMSYSSSGSGSVLTTAANVYPVMQWVVILLSSPGVLGAPCARERRIDWSMSKCCAGTLSVSLHVYIHWDSENPRLLAPLCLTSWPLNPSHQQPPVHQPIGKH